MNTKQMRLALVAVLLLVQGLLCAPLALAETREALFRAAASDDEAAIVGMVLKGLNVGTQDETGQTALLIAAREGSLKVARFLMKQPIVKVNAKNKQDESPLMMAALKGHLELARELIAHKADVNKPGWTPLHYACSNPQPESRDMAALLLENHAYIDAESPNKTTPLMMAAHYGHADAVKLLLEEGADPSLRNEQGLTAVDFARRAGRAEQADMIAAFVRAKQPTGRW
ncbi:MAG TPA: ankyrin repeat domain-containing protein [Hydrogenophaga sp.]